MGKGIYSGFWGGVIDVVLNTISTTCFVVAAMIFKDVLKDLKK